MPHAQMPTIARIADRRGRHPRPAEHGSGAVFAGEVTGNGKLKDVPARSVCAFSGQEDLQWFTDDGDTVRRENPVKGVPGHAQNWGQIDRRRPRAFLASIGMNPGIACNPNKSTCGRYAARPGSAVGPVASSAAGGFVVSGARRRVTRRVSRRRRRRRDGHRRHPGRDLGPPGEPELGEDVLDVGADGPRRQAQRLADRGVGHALRDEPGDLELAGRERPPGLLLGAAAAGDRQQLVGALAQRPAAERVGSARDLARRARAPRRRGSRGGGTPRDRAAPTAPPRSGQRRSQPANAASSDGAGHDGGAGARPDAGPRRGRAAGRRAPASPRAARRTRSSQRSASSGRRAASAARTPVTTNGTSSARSPVGSRELQRPRAQREGPLGVAASSAVSARPQSAGRTRSTSPLARPIGERSSRSCRAPLQLAAAEGDEPERVERGQGAPRRLPRSTSSISAVADAPRPTDPPPTATCAEMRAHDVAAVRLLDLVGVAHALVEADPGDAVVHHPHAEPALLPECRHAGRTRTAPSRARRATSSIACEPRVDPAAKHRRGTPPRTRCPADGVESGFVRANSGPRRPMVGHRDGEPRSASSRRGRVQRRTWRRTGARRIRERPLVARAAAPRARAGRASSREAFRARGGTSRRGVARRAAAGRPHASAVAGARKCGGPLGGAPRPRTSSTAKAASQYATYSCAELGRRQVGGRVARRRAGTARTTRAGSTRRLAASRTGQGRPVRLRPHAGALEVDATRGPRRALEDRRRTRRPGHGAGAARRPGRCRTGRRAGAGGGSRRSRGRGS